MTFCPLAIALKFELEQSVTKNYTSQSNIVSICTIMLGDLERERCVKNDDYVRGLWQEHLHKDNCQLILYFIQSKMLTFVAFALGGNSCRFSCGTLSLA